MFDIIVKPSFFLHLYFTR